MMPIIYKVAGFEADEALSSLTDNHYGLHVLTKAGAVPSLYRHATIVNIDIRLLTRKHYCD